MKRRFLSLVCILVTMFILSIDALATDRQQMSSSEDSIKGHDRNIWDEYLLEPDFNLAIGGIYEIPSYSNAWNYSLYDIDIISGVEGKVINIDNNTITGIGIGKVKIYFYSSEGKILKDKTMSKNYITINVRDIDFITTSKTTYISENNTKLINFKLNQNITQDKSQIKEVPNNNNYHPINKINFADDKIYIAINKKGTIDLKINIEGKIFALKITAKTIKLTTTNMIAYVGETGCKINFKSKIPSGVKYLSSNSNIAGVGANGKITFKKIGRCYIYVKFDGTTIGKCLIEVTYKKQYNAVKNAYSDMNKNLSYSQTKRMNKNYIDCSSFTSRCYYDKAKNRTLYTIGPKSARDWALTAAGQAKWLYDKGKTVAYSKVSVSKLLPGDLVFYRTEYKGLNPEWKHIDHVGMYVGNGMIMDTVTGRGIGAGTGALDLRYYNEDDRVVFIGRPLK